MAKQISSLSVVLGATVKPFVSAFNGLKGTVGTFVSSIGGAAGTLLKFTGIGAAVSAAFAAIKSAGKGISLAAELEQTEVAFTTMLGSASAAQAMMSSLQSFAAATPFEFPEIASSAKSLVAFGVAAGDIPKTLQMVGDVAAGVGVPLNDLAQIYGKAKTQGRLFAEDINQLTGRGIPIIKELAKQFGVSEGEVRGLVESGQIGFPQLQKAFESMTGAGGQFAGLMQAQSNTLAGLWSTLSDTIGMTLAGLTTTIVKAFNVKGAMSGLIGGISSVGGSIQTFVATYAPLIVGWATTIYSTVTGYAGAIYGYVAPIVGQIFGVVASNWTSIVTSTIAMGVSVYSLISSVLNAAWSVVSTVWSGIVGVWQWACGLVGYQAAETGSTVGNTFQGIIDAANWMRTTVAQTFTVLAFGISNFGTIVEYVGTSAAYHLVRFYNVAEWAFGATIDYAKWFGSNLPAIIGDAVFNSIQHTKNMATNLVAIISNLPGLIAGTTSFSDIFTPLTDGMRSTTTELPTIAARIPGELEAALDAQSDQLGASLADGAMNALDELDRSTASVASSIGGTVSGISDQISGAAAPVAPELPKIETAGVAAATEAMDGLAKSTDRAASSWSALAYGSAEAQQASAIAAMQSTLASSKAGTAAATASPLSKATTNAIAKGASDKANGKDDLTAIAKGIFEWLKANGIGPDLVEAN